MAGQAVAKRVALVIGNARYGNAPELKNPANDAREMAAALERLGFHVIKGIDLDRAGFESAARAFARDAEGAEAAAFFYAGHGLQVDGVNYLVPIDAKIEREADVRFNTLNLDDVLRDMGRARGASLVFLDACRNNPLARPLARGMGTEAAGAGRGLAAVRTASGAFVAFATQPDNVAMDGEGANSPFTGALLRHIETPGLFIETMMVRVSRDVFDATDGAQAPWRHSSLMIPFQFREGPARAGDQAMGDPWALIGKSGKPDLIRGFIAQFPGSVEAAEARQVLDAMEREDWRRARANPTLAEMDGFLARYPAGRHATEARGAVARTQGKILSLAAGLALACAILSAAPAGTLPLWAWPEISFGVVTGSLGLPLWLNPGVIAFAAAFAYLLAKRFDQKKTRAFSAFLIVLLGWMSAQTAFHLVPLAFGQAPPYAPSAAVVEARREAEQIEARYGAGSEAARIALLRASEKRAEEMTLRAASEGIARRIAFSATGFLAGVIGAVSVLSGALYLRAAVKGRRLFAAMGLGAGLIALIWAANGGADRCAEFSSNLALFAPWQVWTATCLAWGLAGTSRR